MIYTNSPYEERNLGVTACTFQIGGQEEPDQFMQEIRRCKKQYQEAVVESGNVIALHHLENEGFRMMEMSIHLEASKSELQIPRLAQRFVSDVDYQPATEEEIDYALNYTRGKEIFSTDKIALNPAFGIKKAGQRYWYWMQDLLAEGAICYTFKYKGQAFGFEVVKKDGKTVDLCLGTGYQQMGTGTSLITSTASIKHWMETDIVRVQTNVSSNNPAVLKTHQMYGLKVSGLKYVMSRNI